jgi:uridine kinase
VVSAAPVVLDLALSRARTLGGGRLVCIDGPAGSGKTTLADEVAALHAGAVVVHLDDLYAGWGGLFDAPATLREQVVEPLAREEPAGYRRYDWHAGRFADWVDVPAAELLVVEGCGAGDSSYAAAITVLVWVEAPAEERLARGLARDGEQYRDRWLRWQADEQVLFARERTRDRADVLVDGRGQPITRE